MRLVPDWPDPYGRPIYGRKQKNSQRHKPLGVFKHGYFVCFGQTADTIYLHYTGMDQKLQEGKYSTSTSTGEMLQMQML